ncbi:MAG: hypothetical protein A3F35_02960 [Candidatus Woykebacteria bacterium RIFCSPHIGHO2_12_FULL_45_10]|uniref:Dephospho-CoA kinase n=1 Tax=Candidatus Woykebacteria bacterium RIFCSPHIGHO2_12_FULL_45_10 TaxID=1802603 RepID=A0A1G1WQH1_9BACT|nr:MAG: hypothetical protein A3F35_02960 [Candidatus Woykebacteria bacterium RIFCSPHIGHO2_12_FULL_45_10]
MKAIVVCLIGGLGSGKTTVAEFLVGKGFRRFTYSDLVREELQRLAVPSPDRKKLQDTGDKLREEFGEEVLGERIWEKIEDERAEKAVLDGPRSPADISLPRTKAGKFVALALLASPETRFSRLAKRKTGKDPHSKEDFLKDDQRDFGDGEDLTKQNTASCIQISDYKISTERSLEAVLQEVEAILKKEGII